MNIDTIILVLSTTATLSVGALILLRNPHARVNRIFALLSLGIGLWSTCNYLADNASSGTLLYTRLTFVAGAFVAYTTSLLSRYLPDDKVLAKSLINKIQPYFFILIVVLSLTPAIVLSSIKKEHGAQLEIGGLYSLFVIYMAFIVITFLYNFAQQYRFARLAIQKTQIRLVLTGILTYGLFAILSNLLLPLWVDNWSSSRFGPLFALFMVALLGYTIIRHKLFDIRLIVIRSLAYIESLVIVAVIYGFVVFGVILRAFDLKLNTEAQIVLAVSTGAAALIFPYVKTKLDSLSKKIFYRDAYDVQSFYNEFNERLVSTIEINKLVKDTTELITTTLKAEYCTVALSDSENKALTRKSSNPYTKAMTHYKHYFTKRDRSVVAADYLGSDEHELQRVMNKNNIAVIANLKSSQNEVGYLVLGAKKSGNAYNSLDLRVIETVANEMAIAIQNALRFEEIERFNETLQQKVEDATRKLRRTNEKLRQLDETKDDFISMASHQLRTPLTSVKGYVSMVLDGDAGSLTPLQKKLLNQSFISAQRMVYLISDLLNVSRLRTGKFVIEPIQCNIANMIQEEVKQLVETAKGRGLELVYHKPEHFPVLLLDETKMRQVIMNFIDNAIYYTPAGGTITINLSETPQSIEFTVVDNGIGVPKAEQHHLFSKFFRAHNAKRARPDGTGLGLFMAKKVIVAQGGAIIFKSQEGKGSTFGFSFAKKHLTLPDQPATSDRALTK